MQITIAAPGSPDYAAARSLMRERQRPFFSAEAEVPSDCFVVAHSTLAAGTRPSACAGLTFAGRAPLVPERHLGRPVESLISGREGRVVARCTIVAIDAVASNDATAETELVRALPMLAWCLGRQYVFCEETPRLRDAFGRMGTRFVTLRADRQAADPSARVPRCAEPPALGYGCTTSPTTNQNPGGHYCFDDLVIAVSPADA